MSDILEEAMRRVMVDLVNKDTVKLYGDDAPSLPENADTSQILTAQFRNYFETGKRAHELFMRWDGAIGPTRLRVPIWVSK